MKRISFALSALLMAAPVVQAQTAPATAATTAAPTTTASTPILIGGLVNAPRSITLADLKAMPSREVKVTYTSGSGASLKTNTHTFKGVLLFDLLSAAKPRFNAAAKNDPIRWFVRASALDNYVAVFGWGELDPEFGNKGVLVAYEQDGQPLPEKSGAVQLVVPGDGKGGRYVSNLISLQVFRADY